MSALDENLSQAVECRDLECVAVLFIGMVGAKVGRVSVADAQNAAAPLK